MFNDVFKFLLLGPLVIAATMSWCARASEPFVGFGVDVEHHKNESDLCFSGGFSRNMTATAKFEIGIESNDLRYYFFYKNQKCLLNGDLKSVDDHWRADQVKSRDEMIGFSVNWKTNF
jgi:hypothetical protein